MHDAAAFRIDMLFLTLAGHLLIHVLEQRWRHYRLLPFPAEIGLTSTDIVLIVLSGFEAVRVGMATTHLLCLELGHVLGRFLLFVRRICLLTKDVCCIIDVKSKHFI